MLLSPLQEMFRGATAFNSDLSKWNVVSVRNMGVRAAHELPTRQGAREWSVCERVERSSGLTAVMDALVAFSDHVHVCVVVQWRYLSMGCGCRHLHGGTLRSLLLAF